MKEELIIPFIKSSEEILSQVANIKAIQKDCYIKKELKLKDNIGIFIGMTGAIKGQVVISLTEDIAIRIASNMMGGIPIAVLDDMAKSAVCEMGNMILGNTAVGLYNYGVSIDITPPGILSGKDIIYSTVNNSNILCIPFEIQEEDIEINILFKE